MKSTYFIPTLFLLVLASFSLQIQAETQQWYHVEMIVFENIDVITDEQWPEMPESYQAEIAETAAIVEATTEVDLPVEEVIATDSLNDIASRLKKSPRYQIHYHQAWQQPIMEKHLAEDLDIQSEDKLIDGTLRLYKSIYLHAALNLWLLENNLPEQDEQAAIINDFSDELVEGVDIDDAIRNPNLVETRRIRSKKTYYFDHPKLGVILQLDPIDTPESALADSDLSDNNLNDL